MWFCSNFSLRTLSSFLYSASDLSCDFSAVKLSLGGFFRQPDNRRLGELNPAFASPLALFNLLAPSMGGMGFFACNGELSEILSVSLVTLENKPLKAEEAKRMLFS